MTCTIYKENLAPHQNTIYKQLKKERKYQALPDQLIHDIAMLVQSKSEFRVSIYDIYFGKHWKPHCETFEEFIRKYLSDYCSRSQVFRELNAAKFEVANDLTIGTLPESILRPIKFKKCKKKCLKRIWKTAYKGKSRPTSKDIKHAVELIEKQQSMNLALRDEQALKASLKHSDVPQLLKLLSSVSSAIENHLK